MVVENLTDIMLQPNDPLATCWWCVATARPYDNSSLSTPVPLALSALTECRYYIAEPIIGTTQQVEGRG